MKNARNSVNQTSVLQENISFMSNMHPLVFLLIYPRRCQIELYRVWFFQPETTAEGGRDEEVLGDDVGKRWGKPFITVSSALGSFAFRV